MNGRPSETTHRPYRGRFGQLVTDPRACEAHAMVVQLRRLTTIAMKKPDGMPWTEGVPVADLARASKMSSERVVEIVREFHDAWLLGLIERDGPIEGWGVYEDGE